MEREINRVKNGRYVLIPGSPETRGQGTTGMASSTVATSLTLRRPASAAPLFTILYQADKSPQRTGATVRGMGDVALN